MNGREQDSNPLGLPPGTGAEHAAAPCRIYGLVSRSASTFQPLLRWLLTGRGAALLVWGAWGILLVQAILFVDRYALRMPTFDEWTHFADRLTGVRPITAETLWERTHEHRLPLIQAIVLSLAWLTRGMFHLENYLNALALAGLAAVLIATARRIRGRHSPPDVFFPLALLNFGHLEAFTIRLTLNHVLCAVFSGVVLALMAGQQGALGRRRAVLMGVLLFCLPLCGANGLPLVLMGAAWLLLGARSGDSECSRGRLLTHVAIAFVLLLLVGLYFVGYRSCAYHPPPADLESFLSACGHAGASSFNHYSRKFWPWPALVVPVLILGSALQLAWVVRQRRSERGRALALLCFLLAAAGAIVGVAWGRGGLSPYALCTTRYALVTVPGLLAVYLIWVAYGPASLRVVVQLALCALFCVTVLSNSKYLRMLAAEIRGRDRMMSRAIKEGAPPMAVLPYGEHWFVPAEMTNAATQMLALRDAGIGPFAALQDEPVWIETPLPLTPTRTERLALDGKAWVAREHAPRMVYELPAPQFVHAVRIRFHMTECVGGVGCLEALWHQPGAAHFSRSRHPAFYHFRARQEARTLTIWVNSTIDQLRIDPHFGPCRFEIRTLTLLRKPTPDAGGIASERALSVAASKEDKP